MAEQTNVDLSKSKPMTDKELEELLRKSDQKAEYPEVKFDEFTVPTTEEWVEACNALLKGKPFDKMMYTKNYEGITFDPIYTLRKWKDILPTDNYPGRGDFLRGSTVNGYVAVSYTHLTWKNILRIKSMVCVLRAVKIILWDCICIFSLSLTDRWHFLLRSRNIKAITEECTVA